MDDVMELITRRRRQLYAHSVIYYRNDTSIITDALFDKWAYELRDLQSLYPDESAAAPFAEEFANWDGTTGFDLPWNAWAEAKAAQLMRRR